MTDPKPKFKIGEIVFLITDPEQSERIVTGYTVRPNTICYYVSYVGLETVHYDIEIATTKNWKK